ncbi:MAG TPA: ABC transporter substrate-binding protein [Chloroflexota bacterium]|nr:ABC transporter substrate-binding protein [Chloroflexota bacterium]
MAAPLTVVRVGTLNASTDAPFYLALERGYLREEGLDLETIAFDSGQQMVAPLAADQLDAGGGAVGPGLYNAILRGINLRIVADRARVVKGTRFNCLMARKSLLDSSALRTMADLRGRVFAEPVPANILTYALERGLRQEGVRLDEVRLVIVPWPEMPNAFANGVIDAAFPIEPFVTLASERGVAECWRDTADLAPDIETGLLLYGPTFAEQRTEAARRFMVAYLRAARDYYRAFFGDGQGRAEIVELLTRITPVKDQALLDRIAPTWLDPNGEVNVASLRDTQRWYVERGDLATEVDLQRAIDPGFVAYALERLGRYQVP